MRHEQTGAIKRKRRGSAASQPRCKARKWLTVAAEWQGEHGIELLLDEIQAAVLGLKVVSGLALGLDRVAADMGLLFKGASACGSRQNTMKSG